MTSVCQTLHLPRRSTAVSRQTRGISWDEVGQTSAFPKHPGKGDYLKSAHDLHCKPRPEREGQCLSWCFQAGALHLWSTTEEGLHHLVAPGCQRGALQHALSLCCLSPSNWTAAAAPRCLPSIPSVTPRRGTGRTACDSTLWPVLLKLSSPHMFLLSGQTDTTLQVSAGSLSRWPAAPWTKALNQAGNLSILQSWRKGWWTDSAPCKGQHRGQRRTLGDSRWPKSCEEAAWQAQKASPIFFETAIEIHLTLCSGISWQMLNDENPKDTVQILVPSSLR